MNCVIRLKNCLQLATIAITVLFASHLNALTTQLSNELAVSRADLNQYPLHILKSPSSTTITVGDLHGNALLLYFLVSNTVIQISPGNYRKFVALYKKEPNNITVIDINQFHRWLKDLIIQPTNKLHFLGDDVCDRGMNDYFSLKIFEQLDISGVDFDIVLSNHGNFFLEAYERPEQSFSYNPYGPGKHVSTVQSMLNLGVLINNQVVKKQAIVNVIQNHYLKHIRFPAYILSSNGKEITLFSHAPVDLKLIQRLAQDLGVTYQDATIEQLASSLDAVNAIISRWVMTNTLNYHYKRLKESHEKTNTPSPLTQVLWNRDYTALSRDYHPKGKDYSVYYVHGHDSQKNVFDLDNQFGKGSHNDYGHYAVVFSKEIK